MPDNSKYLAHSARWIRPASRNELFRPALLVLMLAGFAAPSQAQTGSPPVAANSSGARAATNPVRVADLINLPIVDESKSTLGRVRAVVRTGEGKIQLLLPLGGLFGFGERLVPIPIESVAVTGPQLTVVDLPPHRFQKTPTWYGSDSEPLAAAETVSISKR
jgi:PRC-barrel domain